MLFVFARFAAGAAAALRRRASAFSTILFSIDYAFIFMPLRYAAAATCYGYAASALYYADFLRLAFFSLIIFMPPLHTDMPLTILPCHACRPLLLFFVADMLKYYAYASKERYVAA